MKFKLSDKTSRFAKRILADFSERMVVMLADRPLEEISILQYNDENSLSCTIHLAFYFAREYYTMIRELPAGKGFADVCMIARKKYVDKPAIVIELKWDKSAVGALEQIKEKNYGDVLEDYQGYLSFGRLVYHNSHFFMLFLEKSASHLFTYARMYNILKSISA